jgi:hypothetical protein
MAIKKEKARMQASKVLFILREAVMDCEER